MVPLMETIYNTLFSVRVKGRNCTVYFEKYKMNSINIPIKHENTTYEQESNMYGNFLIVTLLKILMFLRLYVFAKVILTLLWGKRLAIKPFLLFM